MKKWIAKVLMLGLLVALVAPSAAKAGAKKTKLSSEEIEALLYLDQTNVTGAKGQQIQLSLCGTAQIDMSFTEQWDSENDTLVSVDETGLVTLKGMAEEVSVYNTVTFEDGSEYKLACVFHISDPSVSSTTTTLSVGQYSNIFVTGLTGQSVVTYSSSNPSSITVTASGQLYAVAPGKSIITVDVDGCQFKLTFIVSGASLNTKWFLTVKGKTKQLKVLSGSGTTATTWKSSNTKVATVSSKGKITTKKIGNATITATVDGRKLTCVVNVTYKKALKVINSAKKVLGKKYSQARRMQKNYYDCSSLVWRMYSKQKVYFGNRNWAPTAAEEARYMVKKKKTVAYKYVKLTKLLPGDVLFIRRGNNGRYRNICHTALYIGNDTIIHANGVKVAYGTYSYYKNNIAVIARPLK